MLFARHLGCEVVLATLMKLPARRPGLDTASYSLIILNRIGCQGSAPSFGNPGVALGAVNAGILDLHPPGIGSVRVEFRLAP